MMTASVDPPSAHTTRNAIPRDSLLIFSRGSRPACGSATVSLPVSRLPPGAARRPPAEASHREATRGSLQRR